jgi:hypothetical protein
MQVVAEIEREQVDLMGRSFVVNVKAAQTNSKAVCEDRGTYPTLIGWPVWHEVKSTITLSGYNDLCRSGKCPFIDCLGVSSAAILAIRRLGSQAKIWEIQHAQNTSIQVWVSANKVKAKNVQ